MTPKEKQFIQEYTVDFCGAKAAERSGYTKKRAKVTAHELLQKRTIRDAINKRLDEMSMQSEEATARLSDIARASLQPFLKFVTKGNFTIDITSDEALTKLHTIKKLRQRTRTTPDGVVIQEVEIELHDALKALDRMLKFHGKYDANHKEDLGNSLSYHLDRVNEAIARKIASSTSGSKFAKYKE